LLFVLVIMLHHLLILSYLMPNMFLKQLKTTIKINNLQMIKFIQWKLCLQKEDKEQVMLIILQCIWLETFVLKHLFKLTIHLLSLLTIIRWLLVNKKRLCF
jgi:hypothetical protein